VALAAAGTVGEVRIGADAAVPDGAAIRLTNLRRARRTTSSS
jgi:hypothetical protein